MRLRGQMFDPSEKLSSAAEAAEDGIWALCPNSLGDEAARDKVRPLVLCAVNGPEPEVDVEAFEGIPCQLRT